MRIASIVLNDFQHDARVLKEARSLRTMGHDVTVIAMHADGLAETEIVDCFQVHRIRLVSRSWSKRAIVQAFKYGEWVVRALWRYRRADVFHCHDLSALPIGVLGKLFLNSSAKVVYDAHEFETEIDTLSPAGKRISYWLEKLLIKHADQVITVSESIAAAYVDLYQIPKPRLILNAPSYADVPESDILRKELGIEKEKSIFLFQGALSPGRGIELMLRTAMEKPLENSVFVFMGYGVLQTEIQNTAKQCSHVFFHPAVSPDQLLTYTASADFGMVLIDGHGLNNEYCMPNKLFEYLMAGLPVVSSDIREVRRVVQANEIGIVIPDLEPAAVRKGLICVQAIDRQFLKSRIDRVRTIYNWEVQEAVLAEIYADLKMPA